MKGYVNANYESKKDGSRVFLGYRYVYNYTDHLGNIRLSYSDRNRDGNVMGYSEKDPYCNTTYPYPGYGCTYYFRSETVEETNYYPFGLKHKGYNDGFSQGSYKYKFGGKELQDELGLNVYDYEARNYMPDIGRTTTIDPLTDQTGETYGFLFNNPLRFIDPTGMTGTDIYELTKTGKLEWRAPSDKDVVYSSDQFENGKLKEDAKGVEVGEQGFIADNKVETKNGGYYINFGENEDTAKQLFFYAAENVAKEFSHTNITFNKQDYNYFSTNTEYGTVSPIMQFSPMDTRVKFNYSIHNHPNDDVFFRADHPSGWIADYNTNPITYKTCDNCSYTGGKGDRGYAEKYHYGTKHYQYTPLSGIIRIYNAETFQIFSYDKTYGK